jgi:hypothetical protein
MFLLLCSVLTGPGPTHPPIQQVLGRGGPFPWGYNGQCMKLHLVSRLQMCIYTSIPPYALLTWFLSKHRHNSTFLIKAEMKNSIHSGNQVSHSSLPYKLYKFLTNSTPTGVLQTWSHNVKVILTIPKQLMKYHCVLK